MSYNLEDLAIFVAVVDAGSLTAASQQLAMPKSKISRRLSKLEAQVGSTLLQRSTRKQSLTESGELLYQKSKPHLLALKSTQGEIELLLDEAKGPLHLLLPQEFFSRFFSDLIVQFAQHYPDIQLACEHYSGALPSQLAHYDLTFILHEQALPDSNCIARELMSMPQSIYQAGFQDCSQLISPEDLLEYDSVLDGQESHWHFRKQQIIQSVPVKARIRLSSLEMRLAATLKGLGIAKLPDYFCEVEVRKKSLHKLCLTEDPIALTLSVLYQNRELPKRVRVFIDFFQTNIGKLYSLVQ